MTGISFLACRTTKLLSYTIIYNIIAGQKTLVDLRNVETV